MRGELLLNATDKTTTQTGATYDIGYAYPINTIILRSVVNVDSVSGGNVVVSVQDSLDGVLWRTLYSFPAKDTAGAYTEHYTPSKDGLVVMPKVRGVAIVTGTIQFDVELRSLFV